MRNVSLKWTFQSILNPLLVEALLSVLIIGGLFSFLPFLAFFFPFPTFSFPSFSLPAARTFYFLALSFTVALLVVGSDFISLYLL